MSKVRQHIIRLERGNHSSLLFKNFFLMLVRRFSPVMSLIYLASIFCIAASTGHLVNYILYDNMAYLRAAFVVFWCAVPAIIWMFLAINPMFSHSANFSYKILVGLLYFTIFLSFLLFPEMEIDGMRSTLVLSFPAFFLTYYCFVIDPLPLEIVYPLNALGICALIWMVSVGTVL